MSKHRHKWGLMMDNEIRKFYWCSLCGCCKWTDDKNKIYYKPTQGDLK